MLVFLSIALVLLLFAAYFAEAEQSIDFCTDVIVVCILGAFVSLFRGDFFTPTPVGLLITLAISGLALWFSKGPYPASWYGEVVLENSLEESRFGFTGRARAETWLGISEILVVCSTRLRLGTQVQTVGVRTRGFRFYYKVRPLT